MECTLCGGWLERCSTCGRSSCATALCSRCAEAMPEVHAATVSALAVGRTASIVYVD
jgi:hypothetical protein